MPWEREQHDGAEIVPKKANGDCVYLEEGAEGGCSLFGKASRPYVCKTFDCRNKLVEWHARGRPELDELLAPVIWAAMKLAPKRKIA